MTIGDEAGARTTAGEPGTATDTAPWDGATYQAVSAPQTTWGERVLSRVTLSGNERALDAGCGSGKLTASLAARLPQGMVLAVDASSSMLTEARRTLEAAGLLERVDFRQADLLRLELSPVDRVDLVFSTATFHWVLDHDALFARLFDLLRPGGRLVAQCGGAGNLRALYADAARARATPARARHFEGFAEPLYFATPEATLRRLAVAGFVDAEASLEDAPTPFAGAAAYRTFVGSVCLRHDLAALPAEMHADFLDEVTALAAQPGGGRRPYELDYVRLNLLARRPD
jgi:trans-aconitate 2-methyltransferase